MYLCVIYFLNEMVVPGLSEVNFRWYTFTDAYRHSCALYMFIYIYIYI